MTAIAGNGGTRTPQPGKTSTATTAATPTTPGASVDWAALESKPLHLPTLTQGAPCPITASRPNIAPDYAYAVGQGLVYMVSQIPITTIQVTDASGIDPGSTWKIGKVYWDVGAQLNGPAIIRGRQLDGNNTVGFNGGLGQTAGNREGTEPILPELRVLSEGKWVPYSTFIRVQSSGCYAFQVDGQAFSDVIVMTIKAIG